MFDPDADEFDDEFLDYARRALEMAGFETDRKLKEVKPIRHSLSHAISEVSFYYVEARKHCPQGIAHWEQAEFIRPALRAAIWDLQWGAIKSYDAFEFLYSRLLSDRAVPFLPGLFAAAALSPSIDAEFGNALMRTLPERER